ncbi:hypothetical protein KPH14_002284 [Odynerus spinipes]|uniref:Uncharacterized protein n=1 Tax=Odynerus spinipes TaxID=1348599 RepID=A0AAD9RLR5_9HYME|nr:hypothetical protein KPH14_002284 [Odynerus spinipes]
MKTLSSNGHGAIYEVLFKGNPFTAEAELWVASRLHSNSRPGYLSAQLLLLPPLALPLAAANYTIDRYHYVKEMAIADILFRRIHKLPTRLLVRDMASTKFLPLDDNSEGYIIPLSG